MYPKEGALLKNGVSQKPIFLYALVCQERLIHKGHLTFFAVTHSLTPGYFPFHIPDLSLYYSLLCGREPAELIVDVCSDCSGLSPYTFHDSIPRIDPANKVAVHNGSFAFPQIVIKQPTHFEFIFYAKGEEVYHYPFWIE